MNEKKLKNFLQFCLKTTEIGNNIYRKENRIKKSKKVEKGKLFERIGRKVMGLRHCHCEE